MITKLQPWMKVLPIVVLMRLVIAKVKGIMKNWVHE